MPVNITDPDTGLAEQFTLSLENPQFEREEEHFWKTYREHIASGYKAPSQLKYCRKVDELLKNSASSNLCLEWLKERLCQTWPSSPYTPAQTFVQFYEFLWEPNPFGTMGPPENRENFVFPGHDISVIDARLTRPRRYVRAAPHTKVLYVAYQSLSDYQYHWLVLASLAGLLDLNVDFFLAHFLPCLSHEVALKYCKKEITLQIGRPLYTTMHHQFFKKLSGAMLSVSVWSSNTYRNRCKFSVLVFLASID